MESQLRESTATAFEDHNIFKTAVPSFSVNSQRETLATLLVNRIFEGRIFPGDRKFVADIIRESVQRDEQRYLQQDVNEILSHRNSEHRLLLDDTMIDTATSKRVVFIYLVEKTSGAITSGMSAVCPMMRIINQTVSEAVPLPPIVSAAVR